MVDSHQVVAGPDLPLLGRRIAVTRAGEQAGELITSLRALGATPIECPAISIAPLLDFTELDTAVSQLESYDWVVFTSVNGVAAVASRMQTLGKDKSALCSRKLAVIGPATREALVELGCQPDFMPDSYVAESIVEQIGGVSGCRVLLPRADIARKALGAGLREKGALVDEVDAYRTITGSGIPTLADLLRQGGADAVTFTSSSTVRYTVEGLVASGWQAERAVELLNGTAIVCIGPITAQTAREYGLKVAAVADEYTATGLVEALVRLFGTGEGGK
ncbi:MAG: uroporphyrinogen-III synthase [Chloroflexota bacterium]|nr:uroporphyrinogen-III synthase [Chloroflexota bacterium]